MARRILNRKELRKSADEAEQAEAVEGGEEGTAAPAKKAAKGKAAGAAKVKKPRKKKGPPRMCARWGVFDAAMKQVAIFDYNQRAAADQKIADLVAKKQNAVYFLQIVKEPMPEAEPAEEVAKS